MDYEPYLTDCQWDKLNQDLPGTKGTIGRPGVDNRRFVEAVIWLIQAGAPWRKLPRVYGNWNSVFRRFTSWKNLGVWNRIFLRLSQFPDMAYIMIDSSIVRAHQNAAGAKKKMEVNKNKI